MPPPYALGPPLQCSSLYSPSLGSASPPGSPAWKELRESRAEMSISWQPQAPRGAEIKAANGRPSQSLAAVGLQIASPIMGGCFFLTVRLHRPSPQPPRPPRSWDAEVVPWGSGSCLSLLPSGGDSLGDRLSAAFYANLSTRLSALGDGQGPWEGRMERQSRCCEQGRLGGISAQASRSVLETLQALGLASVEWVSVKAFHFSRASWGLGTSDASGRW